MANTGNIFPGTGSTVDRLGATDTVWTNPGNIVSDNATDATCSSGSSGSEYLRASNFGFSIPSTATINGVTVSVEASEHTSGTESLNAQLVDDNGAVVGSSKANTISGTAKAVYTYGGTSDVWSATLTPTIVNDTDFGVRCWFTTTHDIRIDYITIAIEYTDILGLTQSVSDTVSLSDANNVALGILIASSDDLANLVDNINLIIAYLIPSSDTLSLSESLILGLGLINSDSLALSDDNLNNLSHLLAFDDNSLNLSDEQLLNLLGFYEFSFSDDLNNLNDVIALLYVYILILANNANNLTDSSEIELVASGGGADLINNLNTIMLDCTIGIN